MSTVLKAFSKEELIEKFKAIYAKGWIENYRGNNDGAVGNILEDLLEIPENNLPIPNAAEWDNIKPLYDKDNKYFFIEKNDECYIFDSSSKTMHRVSYEDIKEFHDGLAIGYDSKIKKYDLIDEELKTIFQLDHMGHSLFYYKNGILCYHTGSWRNGEDFYTIITKSGEVLMQPRRCRVRRNGFDILEISDYKTDNNYLFDLNSGHFIIFEVDVPIIESNNGRELDCSKLPIQQLFLNDFSSFSVEDESNGVKKLLLK